MTQDQLGNQEMLVLKVIVDSQEYQGQMANQGNQDPLETRDRVVMLVPQVLLANRVKLDLVVLLDKEETQALQVTLHWSCKYTLVYISNGSILQHICHIFNFTILFLWKCDLACCFRNVKHNDAYICIKMLIYYKPVSGILKTYIIYFIFRKFKIRNSFLVMHPDLMTSDILVKNCS